MLFRSSSPTVRTFSTTAQSDENAELAISKPCPLCGSMASRTTWDAQGISFLQCAVCGLFRQDPQPAAESVQKRYDDSYLEYETARHLEYREIALKSLAEAGLSPRIDEKHEEKSRSILEIGCATGALLSVFASEGWRAVGVEIGPSMATYARSTFGLDIRTGTIESAGLEARDFDVVIATHLIEHLNEPRSFLKEVHRVLKKEGQLYIVTPNAEGFQSKLLGALWRSAIRDHLYLFSTHTLRAMLVDEGFLVEYLGTWGGWPAGMKPVWLKKPLDWLAKRYGFGDVMIMRCRSVLLDSREQA